MAGRTYPAKRMPTKSTRARKRHKSSSRGIHASVHRGPSGRLVVSLVGKSRLKKHMQIRGGCVHHVGGGVRAATLTAARKKAIRVQHLLNLVGGDRCKLHVKNWKCACKKGSI